MAAETIPAEDAEVEGAEHRPDPIADTELQQHAAASPFSALFFRWD